MACALAVALFFVFEVKNFVQDVVEEVGDKVVENTPKEVEVVES